MKRTIRALFKRTAAPTPHKSTEEAKGKKRLRFYASEIMKKAIKCDTGRDIDVPHRERLRDRQARANAVAVALEAKDWKIRVTGGTLGGDNYGKDGRAAHEVRVGDHDHDYYNFMASRTQQRKDAKATRAVASKKAEAQSAAIGETEQDDTGGKRAISFSMAKNRGLTPHRKRDVRNPRLRNRRRYDTKKRKLASIRPVYRSDSQGPYGGELTGIKTHLVKSVKL